jgi:hypothetical protein
MEKLDYRKDLKELYSPSAKRVSLVDVPRMNFVAVEGRGDPNTSGDFRAAMQALYTISYATKFMLRKEGAGPEFSVAPAEALWWTGDAERFDPNDKRAWRWKLMIMQPRHISIEIFDRARSQASEKKEAPALQKAEFIVFHEGLSAQVMHIGPYAEESAAIERLYAFIEENGYSFNGRHHEIYLGDPGKTRPERLKTVIRQPVRRSG